MVPSKHRCPCAVKLLYLGATDALLALVIMRLRKYHTTLKPGLSIVLPYIDQVAYVLLTKDEPLNIEQQEAITKDNAVILCTAITFVKVLDPVKASYGISNYRTAIQFLVMTNQIGRAHV